MAITLVTIVLDRAVHASEGSKGRRFDGVRYPNRAGVVEKKRCT